MALRFRPRSFVAYEREVKVVGVDRGAVVIFRLDLLSVSACLDWAQNESALDVVERRRDVIELTCRVAYSRDQDRPATMQLYTEDILAAVQALRKVAETAGGKPS